MTFHILAVFCFELKFWLRKLRLNSGRRDSQQLSTQESSSWKFYNSKQNGRKIDRKIGRKTVQSKIFKNMQSGGNKSTFEVSHELQHEKKMTKSHKIFDGIFKSFTERFRTQCRASQFSPSAQMGQIGRHWFAQPSKGHNGKNFLVINYCSTYLQWALMWK